MPHTIDSVYQDGPSARVYRYNHDHAIADAEQQYGHGNNCHGGHGTQELNQHLQQTIGEAKITENNSESYRNGRRQKITFQEAKQSRQEVRRQLPRNNQVEKGTYNLTDRGYVKLEFRARSSTPFPQ